MSFIKALYKTILEAIFPLSPAEKELFSLSPEKAEQSLPRASASPIPDARGVLAYKDERVAKLIWNIKYKKSKKATAIGAFILYKAMRNTSSTLNSPDQPITIIPMPITIKRRRERGFNQCELICEEIKKLDSTDRFRVISNLLVRIQHKDRQTLKNRSDRLVSARGIFSVDIVILDDLKSKDSQFLNKDVLIIDDVITTGSTMKEALETMRNAGFKKVKGISIAH
ncbi:MAG: phosphoribosyltransferase family protein [Candidatus Paceibacterota bacterium]|jgi:ComF family protein